MRWFVTLVVLISLTGCSSIEKYKEEQAKNERLVETQTQLGVGYYEQGNLEVALEKLKKAIEVKPDYAFLCQINRPEEAEKYFLKAVNLPLYRTPELAYENAGACMRRVPDTKKAETYLDLALDINPRLPTALINMAEIRFEQNRFLSSRAYLQRFEAVSPHSAESLWLGIRIERKLGDKNAEANYKKQLQSNFPKSRQFKMMLNSLEEDQS
ncbi:MAG: hypothetical protein P8Y28_12075 [Gammaproteobacteria bacterium]